MRQLEPPCERMRLVMRGERRSGPSQDLVRGLKVLLEGTRQCRREKCKVGKTSLQDRGDSHGKTQGTKLRPKQPKPTGNREPASWQYLRIGQWERNKEESLPTYFLTTVGLILSAQRMGEVSLRVQMQGIFPYSSTQITHRHKHTHVICTLTHTKLQR